MLEAIIDYTKDDDAVDIADEHVITPKGRRMFWNTDKGWKLNFSWVNVSESWLPLKYLKECNTVEVAEFAKERGLEKEPEFCWLFPYVLMKRDSIISNENFRVRKKNHEHGIEISATIEYSKRLHADNWNDFLTQVIKK